MRIEFVKKTCSRSIPTDTTERLVVSDHAIIIAKVSVNGKPWMALVNTYEPDEMVMYRFKDKNYYKPSAFFKEVNRLIVGEGFRISGTPIGDDINGRDN